MIWIGLKKKEMKKIRPIKSTWYDWLINYIPEPIRKRSKANTPKQTVYGRGKKLSKPRKQNIKKPFISEVNKQKNQDKIIRDIWILFETEEEKEETKKQENNERLIKDKIIRDIRTLFEQQEEDYYKPKRVSSFWNNNYIEYENNGDKSSSL